MKYLKPLRYFLLAAAIVALVYGLTQTGKTVKARRHDAEDVHITVTAKTRRYDPNASGYTNGCYYIYFQFSIENNTAAPIDYLTVLTHITDRNGNDLGTVRSEFGSIRIYQKQSDCLELAPGASVQLQTYLQEHRPESNDFFTKTYNAAYEDLVFTCEPESIYFSDNYHISP